MSRYEVRMAIPVFLTITVEADSPDDAVDEAYSYAYLDNYVGNGGFDKLVGTTEGNVSLGPGDEVLEGNGFTIDVKEITE